LVDLNYPEENKLFGKFIKALMVVLACLLISRCANPVSPTGGPKDTTPPVILKYAPPLNSRNFSQNKIRITFDEFIKLKDINSQVIISPPMDKTPEFKLRGKSLIIEMTGTLKENTTYNIFFGNSIVDLTENNAFENFQYVFSTGNVIDSLSISGSIYNAFDLVPVKNINVMLYLNINDTIPFDSLPYFVRPYYLTKTDASGNFTFNNLINQPFKLFALNDQNSNMIYDQPSEAIAFLDSLISPVFIQTTIPDSIESDTLVTDNIEKLMSFKSGIKLALFNEADSTQKLIKVALVKKNLLSFFFKRPVTNLIVRPLNLTTDLDWGIQEVNITKDTVNYWLKNIIQDSIIFEISDNNIILDTVKVAAVKKSKDKKQGPGAIDTTLLTIRTELKANHSELYQPFKLIFDYPVTSFNPVKLQLFEHDTIPVEAALFFTDPTKRKFVVDYKWTSATPYKLLIIDSAFFDILNRTNDTLSFTFISKSVEDYGNFFVNVSLPEPETNVIFQLLSGDKVREEFNISGPERLSFIHLTPGDYKLKAIFDSNKNGKWDTGDYYYKIQPEEVQFFSSGITIRANWDIEEDWEL
jgi:hypothetical protein